jgi:hypothetical protein
MSARSSPGGELLQTDFYAAPGRVRGCLAVARRTTRRGIEQRLDFEGDTTLYERSFVYGPA